MSSSHNENPTSGFRSGFAAIAGAPNVGKSTLLNRMIGQKISITSQKPQTTRNRIVGVMHGENSQIVFLDTPGVHKSDKMFNRKIVQVALSAMDEVDLVLVVIDASNPESRSESMIIEKLKKRAKIPAVLAVNKIDRIEKPNLLRIIDKWSGLYPSFAEIVPISALEGTQVDRLVEAMTKLLPEGPPFFPEDALTDMPERFIVCEMIREKVFENTGREVPYGTAVTIEDFSEDGDIIRIHAAIHVERNSQKGIIIGKNGAMLKTIGTQARMDIENLLGAKVFLKLFVRVEKNWSRDTRAIRKLGY
ncbi:MAG: GTPase Era [Desulfosalsimonadaceae bacterium]